MSSCSSLSHGAKGGIVGTLGGAAAGAAIGKAAGNTAAGAIIGAAVGGTAGALIGRRMDKQAAEMRKDLKNAKIERVGEGIKITFDSGILFDVNSSSLKSAAKQNIRSLSETLKKYGDTEVMIIGHTDASGSDDYNQTLSEKRAAAVASYATSLGVATTRINTMGAGESQPVADNSTAAGKKENRRVELAIYANEKLKKAAKRGDIPMD